MSTPQDLAEEQYPSEASRPIARRLLEIAPEPRRSPVQPD
jgi:hypothetical protein